MQGPRIGAYWLALLLPAALLGGALIAQYGFGLPPCEMCWWQRYPHVAALALALAGWVKRSDTLIWLAAGAILTSGLIGAWHAGIEYGWWEGVTQCSSTKITGDPLEAIMNAPLIRCDRAPWDLFGISLAGWNFLISAGGAVAIHVMLARANRTKGLRT